MAGPKEHAEGSAGGWGLNTPIVAVLLCGLSTLQAMAAIWSKDATGSYPYKIIASTLLSELFKLVTSAVLLTIEIRQSGESFATLKGTLLRTSTHSMAMAAIPGISYQVLNNLNFVTLYYVDAPTFQILGNLKIVATGMAGQVLLRRYLSRGKWLALMLLTLGAAISQIPQQTDVNENGECEEVHWFAGKWLGYASSLICVFLSATMGVFTEMYMKGNRASIHWQNLQLYLFGIIANVFALLYRNEIGPGAGTPLLHGFNAGAVVCVITNGSCGLAVSFMLRYADSIAKTYATALAIPCTALAAWAIFATPISVPSMLGSCVMIISLMYYYFGAEFFVTPKVASEAASVE